MAFVFRSKRDFNYQKDPNFESILVKDDQNVKINSDVIRKLKNKEKSKQLNKLYKEKSNNKISSSKYPPFSSNSEKTTLNIKDGTPGPGTYDVNKLYFNRHRQFSSREDFSDSIELDFLSLPSIRLKETVNDNPGPGQYNLNEKDLFGGKFKKMYNMKTNTKQRNISSKSARDIFTRRKNGINKNMSNIIDKNKFDDMKDFILVYSSKTKNENSIKNKNNNNEKSSNTSSIINIREHSTFKNNESEIIKNKMNKNNSHISAATLDTQRSSLNTSNLTLTNPRNVSSKILIPKLVNDEIMKCFISDNKEIEIENNAKIMLNTIDREYGKNDMNTIAQFKYDKSKIITSSQDHDRIMQINETKNNYSKNYSNISELLLDQELFSQNPGPGYYSPIEPCNQKYFSKKNISNTGIEAFPKIQILKRISPGPGEYKIDNNSIENILLNKDRNIRGNKLLFDVKKIAKLRIANEKQSSERTKKIKLYNAINSQLKITYDNNSKEIADNQNLEYRKKKVKQLLFNFGSNDIRFKIPKKKIPGVGEYDINNYNSIEEKNLNIVENPSYKELLQKLENKKELLERAPLNKDLVNNPGVGYYNPDIITSIKYNDEVKNIINTQPINKKKGFKKILQEQVLHRAKEIKEKEKQLINFLGPGKYFNLLNKTFKFKKNKSKESIRPAFGSSENKFENIKQDLKPGPGQYDINSYYNWITRTYNVLFY